MMSGLAESVPVGAERRPRPIFVIGPAESGTRLLAWSLGQHPRIRTVQSAAWILPLCVGIDRAQEDDAASPVGAVPAGAIGTLGLTREDLWARVSATVDALLLEPERMFPGAGAHGSRPGPGRHVHAPQERWTAAVDGDRATIYALGASFPEARFVHLVRDVREVVQVASTASRWNASPQTLEQAVRRWRTATDACLDAEAAFGSSRCTRIAFPDVVAAPHETLRRCLSFLGEEDDERCAWVPQSVELMPPSPDDVERAIGHENLALSEALLSGADAVPVAPEDALNRLRRAFDEARDPTTRSDERARIQTMVEWSVPLEASVAVVSKGDDRLLDLGGRKATHFPCMPDGTYAGHHPETGADAVAHLERLRGQGVEYLVLPTAALWWLEFYDDLRAHLSAQYAVCAHHEATGMIFRLTEGAGSAPNFPLPFAHIKAAGES